MDRLSIFLTLMTGAVLTGALVTIAFSAGYVGWFPIMTAVVIGWVLAWPVAYWISRRIKKNDDGWNEDKVDQVRKPVPRPGAPEV